MSHRYCTKAYREDIAKKKNTKTMFLPAQKHPTQSIVFILPSFCFKDRQNGTHNMKKIIYAFVLIGLAGYLLYRARYNIAKTLSNTGALLPDEGGTSIGNTYPDKEDTLLPRYKMEDGVGGSDFFDMGEGGVTGIRPSENFEKN